MPLHSMVYHLDGVGSVEGSGEAFLGRLRGGRGRFGRTRPARVDDLEVAPIRWVSSGEGSPTKYVLHSQPTTEHFDVSTTLQSRTSQM